MAIVRSRLNLLFSGWTIPVVLAFPCRKVFHSSNHFCSPLGLLQQVHFFCAENSRAGYGAPVGVWPRESRGTECSVINKLAEYTLDPTMTLMKIMSSTGPSMDLWGHLLSLISITTPGHWPLFSECYHTSNSSFTEKSTHQVHLCPIYKDMVRHHDGLTEVQTHDICSFSLVHCFSHSITEGE